MTGMTGLYEIFEPERVAWWNSVCRTFSDEVQRIQLHNYRLAKKARDQPALCPIMAEIEPAIPLLTIPLLPFEAEEHLAQAKSYNLELTMACLPVAADVTRNHDMRGRGGVEGAGPGGRHVRWERLPGAPWREPTTAELVAGEPHLFMVNHPDGNVSIDAAPLAQWLANFEANVAHALRVTHDDVRRALAGIVKLQGDRAGNRYQATPQQQRQYTGPRSNNNTNGAPAKNNNNNFKRGAYTKGGEEAAAELKPEPPKVVDKSHNSAGFP